MFDAAGEIIFLDTKFSISYARQVEWGLFTLVCIRTALSRSFVELLVRLGRLLIQH